MKKDINCLKIDDQQATNSFVISNYFNKFFTTIAKKIESIIVENRATQDTFESLKVKFFCHFYIPFFFIFLRPEKLYIETLRSVPWLFYFPLL